MMNMSDSDAKYRVSKNKENRVKCPYCDATTASRGLYQHVWRSGDEAHGGHKQMPDDWDDVTPEVVGEQDVTIHVPTSKKFDHDRLLCKYCGEDFQGTHGLSVHLSRTEDSLHPNDATVEQTALRVPVGPDDSVVLDDDMLEEVRGHNLDPGDFSDASILKTPEGQEGGQDDEDADQLDTKDGHVPIPDLVELVGYYERDGQMEAAEELRKTIQRHA